MKNFYAVLGVAPDSDDVVIRAAYRALMLKYHPDTNQSNDATARAAAINEAFAVLGDPVSRKKYDDACAASEDDNASQAKAADHAKAPAPEPDRMPETFPPPVVRIASVFRNGRWGYLAAGAFAVVAIWIGEPKSSADGLMLSPEEHAELESAADRLEAGAMSASGNEKSAGPTSNTAITIPIFDKYATPPTLEYEVIEEAANTFERVLQKSGISGARNWSKRCHIAVEKAPTWRSADGCAAFDFAARYIDKGAARSGIVEDGYFKFQDENQVDNYLVLTDSTYVLPERLRRIRSAVEPAVYSAITSGIARRQRNSEVITPQPQESSQEGLGDDWLDRMTGNRS